MNALSAGAFLLAAIVLHRRSRPLAVALSILGLGSFAFHQAPGFFSGWLDGFGVALVALAIIDDRWSHNFAVVVRSVVVALVAVLTLPTVLRGPLGLVLMIVAIVMVVRTTPPRWILAGLVTGGAGAALYVLGRTGGPLCHPDSLVQPHAAWHVLAAAAIVAVSLSYRPNPDNIAERGENPAI